MFKKIAEKRLIKRAIAKSSEEISLNELYKILAFSGLIPRVIKENIGKNVTIVNINDVNLDLIDKLNIEKTKVVIINVEGGVNCPNFENIFIFRRYSDIKIIIDDNIIDRYQIIKYLAYGADAIILKRQLLSIKDFLYLADISLNVGLNLIAEMEKDLDIALALKAGAMATIVRNKNIPNVCDILCLEKEYK